MKRILVIGLAVLMLAGLTACSDPKMMQRIQMFRSRWKTGH